jgi:RNA polymerase sigma factor for flagellar operon FliA
MAGSVEAYESTVRRLARDQLVLDHLEFVRQVLGKLAARLPRGTDTENLESAGVLGLIEAAQQFDPERGVEFKVYAFSRIRGAIVDELRRNCPLPQPLLRQIAKVRAAYESLPPPVSPEALAERTQLPLDEVVQCLNAMRLTRPEPWNDLTCTVHHHWQTDAGDPGSAAEAEEAQQVLADGIEQLPSRERIVITLYHLEDLRLREIAEVLELSESRVSRLLAQAEFRLKEYVRARFE